MESLSEQDGILTTKKVPAVHQTCDQACQLYRILRYSTVFLPLYRLYHMVQKMYRFFGNDII